MHLLGILIHHRHAQEILALRMMHYIMSCSCLQSYNLFPCLSFSTTACMIMYLLYCPAFFRYVQGCFPVFQYFSLYDYVLVILSCTFALSYNLFPCLSFSTSACMTMYSYIDLHFCAKLQSYFRVCLSVLQPVCGV